MNTERSRTLVMALRATLLLFGIATLFAASTASAQSTPDAPGVPAPGVPAAPTPAMLFMPVVGRNVEMPRVILPFDGQKDASPNANLLWSLTNSAGVSFRVLLDKGSGQPVSVLADGVTQQGVDAPELALQSDYSWQVITRWPDGYESAGPVWHFHTEASTNAPNLDAMVSVPEGSFWMGCDRRITSQYPCSWNQYHQDEPLRSIWLSAFEIDKYEVTNREYKRCVDAGGCQLPRHTTWYDDPALALTPVVFVSWEDAGRFCAWEGKRLPTEAEWEKAARGTVDTRVYPWGNQEPTCTRVYHQAIEFMCRDSVDRPQQVGTRPTGASPYGAYDMAGNVFEWVHDKYDVWYYNYGPTVNPQGPPFSRVAKSFGDPNQPPQRDEYYVPVYTLRGGTYSDEEHYMRVSHRHWGHHGDKPFDDYPWFRNRKVGFRCAASLP